MLVLSIIAAIAPVLAYMMGIWWMDRYEREPFRYVLGTFLYGAVGAVFLAVVGSLALIELFDVTSEFAQAALVAPIAEEPAKALIILFLLRSRQFDNTTDGLIYGAATGLGFAMTENFFYFIGAYEEGGVEAWSTLVAMRSVFSALMHCCASALFGACVGAARYRGVTLQWFIAPAVGLALAVAVHATFNGLLMQASVDGNPLVALGGLGLVVALVILLLALTQAVLTREHRALVRELAHEAAAGLLPTEHAARIPYYLRRHRLAGLPPHTNREEYVRAVTLLAFRRVQHRRTGHTDEGLAQEIDGLRRAIQDLLRPKGEDAPSENP